MSRNGAPMRASAGANMTLWDPDQYRRFADERARPFHDLLARLPPGGDVARVVDLGCGSGEMTRSLLDRWPGARILGIDNSRDMLAAAAQHAADRRVAFAAGDIAEWQTDAALDVVIANASLHWVPDHARLLRRLVAMLRPDGFLAVQMPYNHEEPCYALYDRLRGEPRWTAKLGPATPQYATETPRWYADALLDLGCTVDLWETIYHHRLAGPDAVVEWVKGTLLRPSLTKLSADEQRRFLDEYGALIAADYAASAHGTLLQYRRLFFVARRAAHLAR